MYPCNSVDDFVVNDVNEDNDVTNKAIGNNDEQMLCQDQCLDFCLDSHIDDLLKSESLRDFSDFPDHYDLHQYDNLVENLLSEQLSVDDEWVPTISTTKESSIDQNSSNNECCNEATVMSNFSANIDPNLLDQYFDPYLDCHIDNLLKNESLRNFLASPTRDDVDEYNGLVGELFPDMQGPVESSLELKSDNVPSIGIGKRTIISSYNFEQPSTSCSLKRSFVEDESLLVSPSIKRVDFKQNSSDSGYIDSSFTNDDLFVNVDTNLNCLYLVNELVSSDCPNLEIFTEEVVTSSVAKSSEKSVLVYSDIDQHNNFEISKQSKISKVLKLRKYRRNNLRSAEFIASIYEDAIKKIDIDGNVLFKNSVLEEIGDYISNKGFTKPSIDLSLTYSNVRKYILDNVSPCINDIITTADVLIASGMTIPDIHYNCMSNKFFFEKLHASCKKIVESISSISDFYFLNMIQSHLYFDSNDHVSIVCKKNKLCSKAKDLVMDTIYNLPHSIMCKIESFDQIEIANGIFSDVHGVSIPKSLIRNLNLFPNYSKNELRNGNFDNNLNLLNKLLAKVRDLLKQSCILHEWQVIFMDESLVEPLSKYLLSDMYGVPVGLHKKLNPSIENTVKSYELGDEVDLGVANHIKGAVNCRSVDRYLPLPEKSVLVPRMNSRWDPSFITSSNIYELAVSMISIDKGDFEDCCLVKIKDKRLVNLLDKGSKVNLNFSVTYDRVRGYILEVFLPFLKKIEEETKVRVKINHETTLEDIESAYILNREFFTRLRKFCSGVISRIINYEGNALGDMMQYVVHLETETKERHKLVIRKDGKFPFGQYIARLLVKNISTIPERIVSTIKLLPRSKLVEGHFSPFYNMYVDNLSLLKAKLVFDNVQKKITNDKLLISLADKISSDMLEKFGVKGLSDISRYLRGIINGYAVCEGLFTFNYIRKLAREEIPTLRDNLSGDIIVMYHDKIETADQKVRREILDKLIMNLITVSIRYYKNLCIDKYNSKI